MTCYSICTKTLTYKNQWQACTHSLPPSQGVRAATRRGINAFPWALFWSCISLGLELPASKALDARRSHRESHPFFIFPLLSFGASKQLKISFPPVVSPTILTALGCCLTLAFPQRIRKKPFVPAENCKIGNFLLSGPAFPVLTVETTADSILHSHSTVLCSFRQARRSIVFAILPAALCH